ncbi:MAG: TRAP transporter small permease [Spirochaetes bacterium]|nr:TRAP transporter small permease [Spirochaetota bacterium]
MKDIIKKIINFFRKIEVYSLVVFVILMLVISFLQMIIKFFRFGGFDWLSPVLKYIVLWSGMIAASIATYEKKHIKIDVISKFAHGKMKRMINIITNFFAAFTCFFISVISWVYIFQIEYTSNEPPPFFNIPRWVLLLIVPACFLIMGVRFSIQGIKFIVPGNQELLETEEKI